MPHVLMIIKATITTCPKCDKEVMLLEGYTTCLGCQRSLLTEPLYPDLIPPDHFSHRSQHEKGS